MSSESTTLSPYFSLKPERNLKPIQMSYGRLNQLAQLVPDPTRIAEVYVDIELQQALISTVLGDYNPETQTFQPANVHAIQIDLEEATNLLAWIVEHLLDFFVRQLERAKGLEAKYVDRLTAYSQPSPDGLKA